MFYFGRRFWVFVGVVSLAMLLNIAVPTNRATAGDVPAADQPAPFPLDVTPEPIASDKSIKYDYPIVYVRAPKTIKRGNREVPTAWPEFGHPTRIDPGYDAKETSRGSNGHSQSCHRTARRAAAPRWGGPV